MKPLRTLFLLAADQDFRLLRGSRQSVTEVLHHQANDFPDVNFEFSSPGGRNQTGPGATQFGIGEKNVENEQERKRFAVHVVKALATEWAQGGYGDIVVAAGPKMLGELRAAMPKSLTQSITAELAKDLVKVSEHDLPSHLGDVGSL